MALSEFISFLNKLILLLLESFNLQFEFFVFLHKLLSKQRLFPRELISKLIYFLLKVGVAWMADLFSELFVAGCASVLHF